MDIVLTTHTDDRSARTHGATHRTAEETHAMPTGYMAPDKLGEKMEQVEAAVPDGQSLHHFFFAALHINLGACNVLTDHEVRASDEHCAALPRAATGAASPAARTGTSRNR
jgi:hypothetical protein